MRGGTSEDARDRLKPGGTKAHSRLRRRRDDSTNGASGGFGRIEELGVGFAAGQAAFFGGELECFLAVELGLADELVDAVGERLGSVVRSLARQGRTDEQRDFAADGLVFEGSR